MLDLFTGFFDWIGPMSEVLPWAVSSAAWAALFAITLFSVVRVCEENHQLRWQNELATIDNHRLQARIEDARRAMGVCL